MLMKILLVEDSRTVASVMMARLVSFGHDVKVAENGQIAVDLFSQWNPDLVLMDIEMPVMNGFEATNRIRALEAVQQWAWTPIIFLTASDTEKNLLTAIEAGGDDFMAKAVPEVVLRAKMKAMVRIATLRQRLSFANKLLEEQASRDWLTGLCNRRYMDLRVDAAWAEAVRLGQPFGLYMIDVDNFKKYNDLYGHQSGDECLRGIASALLSVVNTITAERRGEDLFAARYGGEEFAIIAPNVTAAVYEDIGPMVLKAVRGLGLLHEANESWRVVTISVGGSYLASAADKVVDLFRKADARLYRAKKDGRNRALLWD